ncbi:hypothetical protein JCM21900_003787 [Sporobolomyces salmonicolor]
MYLHWPRTVFFLVTQSLCIATIGLAAWALADGVHKEHEASKSGLKLDISDIVGAGGAVTAAAGLSSLLCLGMLGYTLFHPRRKEETLFSVRVKEALFGVVLIVLFATLVPATVFAATRGGKVTAPGVPQAVVDGLVKASGMKLAYNTQRPVLSYVIVGWIAFLSTLISLVLVSLSARHVLKHGHSYDRRGSMTDEEPRRSSTVVEKERTSIGSRLHAREESGSESAGRVEATV